MPETENKIEYDPSATRSTSDFVYNALRQAIITHRLPAGTRLVEAKTSKDLNVSITPVRQAFARLANQGLLTVFPYKGTYVTVISREYVDDVYYLRQRLETMAAERAFNNLTDEDIAYYEKLCTLSDIAYDNKDLYESIRCDVLFHEYLFTIGGSSLLLEMWKIIKYRIEIIQSYTKTAMNARMSVRHAPMMEMLRKRDGERYVAALIDHLNSSNQCMYFPAENTIEYD